MKRKNYNYCQIYNNAIDRLSDREKKIPLGARWLYIVLNKLEHRLSGEVQDFFYRSIRQLEEDSGLGHTTIVSAIKVLKEMGLIHTWQMHWVDRKTEKKSEKHITAFRILEI